MSVIPVLIGFALFLVAFDLWSRARKQPEDIPMYSLAGHRLLSRKDAYVGAFLSLIVGIVFVIVGLLP